jgi:hypothetical protein
MAVGRDMKGKKNQVCGLDLWGIVLLCSCRVVLVAWLAGRQARRVWVQAVHSPHDDMQQRVVAPGEHSTASFGAARVFYQG